MTLTLLCVLSVVAVGWVDYLTGPEIGFSLFYLVPVGAAAWYAGRGPGIVVAILGAASWLAADIVNRTGVSLGASVWNGFTRGVIFIAIALLLDGLRQNAARLAIIDRQREEFLRVLERELPEPTESIAALAARFEKLGRDRPDERALVEELKHRATELRFLARDFVSLGQLQSARFTLAKTHADLNQLVREAVRQVQDKERVIVTLGAEAPTVDADVDRLRQAIESVVRSALRHSTEYVNVTVRADAQQAWVDVSDRSRVPLRADDFALFNDPRGVSAARAAVVGDRFLGLQLARLLMEAHGGSLVIESPPTLGSLVRLRIPRVTRGTITQLASA